jgi:replicative DNA helicase
MLVNIGAAAIEAGFNVCHYTLELSEDYVGKRYDALLTGINVQDLAKHKTEVQAALQKIKGKLIIKEFAMGKVGVSGIESHIQKCKDLGHAPDVIIIDYVDLLKAKRGSSDRKDEIDDVYTATKGLARELKIPIWTVSQVNRMGAKDDVIEGDKAAGSYNKMMIADFAISLSRKRQDKVNGTGRVHIMKNRYGGDGMTYPAKVDTTNGCIEISDQELDEDAMQMEGVNMGSKQGSAATSFTREERSDLAKKFFELGK